jgi:hypothetical protein
MAIMWEICKIFPNHLRQLFIFLPKSLKPRIGRLFQLLFPFLQGSRLYALSAFRTAMSFRFVEELTLNRDIFAAYKASLGFIWA